jgi:hypothetical protein
MSDAGAPLPLRLRAYLAERFPVVASLLTAFLLGGSADVVAQAASGARPALDHRTAASTFFVFCALFVLRVLDEHKDFEDDLRAHPERVLQRGVVKLRELDALALLATAVLLAAAASAGLPAFAAAVGCLLFLGLMRAEFFVSAFLKRRPLLYALTHQGITPLLCAAVVIARGASATPASFWQAAAAAGLGLVFEIGRKVRAPEEEIEGDDSYSGSYGPARAAIFVVVSAAMAAGAAAGVVHALGAPSWAALPAVAGALFVSSTFIGFSRAVKPGRGKILLGAVALGALLTYASIGVAAFQAAAGTAAEER